MPQQPDAKQQLEQQREIVRQLVHDLRSPLAVLATTTDLLRQYNERLSTAKREHYLDSLYHAVFAADRLLARLSYLNDEIITQAQSTTLTQLQTLLRRRAAKLYPVEEMRWALAGDLQQQFEIDIELLQVAAIELIDNGVKHGSAGSTLQIELMLSDGTLTFRVINQGEPIDAAQLDGDAAQTALGLATARKLAAALGGELRLAFSDGRGTCVELTAATLPAQSSSSS